MSAGLGAAARRGLPQVEHAEPAHPLLDPGAPGVAPSPGEARCAVAGCACHDIRRLPTVANAVTLARTLGSLVLVALAFDQRSFAVLVAAYALYWLGDMADGALARRLRQETRVGAVLDIVCDRLNCTACILALLLFVPAPAPVAVFVVQFVVVDLVLSLLPLRWPVLSPNYFSLVDRRVYALNWHPAAKATNTALLVVLLVTVADTRFALAAACAVLGVKLYSLTRVLRLPRTPAARHVALGAPGARARRPAGAGSGAGSRVLLGTAARRD